MLNQGAFTFHAIYESYHRNFFQWVAQFRWNKYTVKPDHFSNKNRSELLVSQVTHVPKEFSKIILLCFALCFASPNKTQIIINKR